MFVIFLQVIIKSTTNITVDFVASIARHFSSIAEIGILRKPMAEVNTNVSIIKVDHVKYIIKLRKSAKSAGMPSVCKLEWMEI